MQKKFLEEVLQWRVFETAQIDPSQIMLEPVNEDDTQENDTTETDTTQLVAALLELLSDAFGFYIKAHTAHWNVTGSDFEEYHALFGAIYEDVLDSLDDLAEDVRKLGSPVPLDVQSLVTPLMGAQATDPKTLATDLLAFNTALIEEIKDAFDIATAARSQGIANFLAERQDKHEKWQWQLSASLS